MAGPDALVLDTSRRLDAAPDAVYAACTEPEVWGKWWGPRGFESRVEADVRVGGRYQIAMQPPEGGLFHLTGKFREVQPGERLSYTFVWDPADPDDRETVVTLSFEERDGSTQLTLHQEGFATEERLQLHVDGWGDSLDRLDELLAQRGRS